jgi:competence ComEA-like helix-hairpin-helix protein
MQSIFHDTRSRGNDERRILLDCYRFIKAAKGIVMRTQILTFFLLFLTACPALGARWSETVVKLLPDESFAVIEVDDDGHRHRRCPYRNGGGDIDDEQLIRALGELSAIDWIDPVNEKKARRVLESHYRRCHEEIMNSVAPLEVNLNDATLKQLVRLPNIGPVLAVKIVDYRDRRAMFTTPEDIMKVDGISRNTFMAIRHYIRVD